jgi:sulfatase modifying factor 1
MNDVMKRSLQSVGLVIVGTLVGGGALGRPAGAAVGFDWALIGNSGNAADTLVMDKGPAADYTTGYGAVGYDYQISKYDVTNSQYVTFLNTVDPAGTNPLNLWDKNMQEHVIQDRGLQVATTGGINRDLAAAEGARYSVKPGQEQFPAVWVRWSSAARFVNWLSNGQGAGGTENGVYDMSVLTTGFATPPARAAGATVFLPSEDEFYKAAYYDPSLNGGVGGYWQYGTQTNTPPASSPPPGTAPAANIGVGNTGGGGTADTMALTGQPYDATLSYLTDVGAYATSTSAYGLYDTDGLIYNWTETTKALYGSDFPVIRGGSWRFGEEYDGAAYRNIYSGANVAGYASIGFRVAGLPTVPSDIVIDVASGTVTQAQAGYAEIATADSVTKTGAGTLVFDAANAYTGPTTVSAGTLQIANADAIAGSSVTVDTGATLAVAAGVTMKAPSVIVDGGTLSASALAVNSTSGIASLAINAGTIAGSPSVSIAGGGGMALPQDARVTVGVGGLAVDQAGGGGRLDLGAGQVSVAAGGISAADLRADIIAGRNGGAWNGTVGITSSTAASAGGARAVGYVVAGDGSAKVSFAAPGDVDLSGAVNVFDLVSVNSGGKYGTGTAAVWNQGDFNYDGVTNVFDLVGVNTGGAYGQGNYFPAAPTAAGLGSVATVPEPSGLALIMAAAGCLTAATRRKNLRRRPASR